MRERAVLLRFALASALLALPTAGRALVLPVGVERMATDARWIVDADVSDVRSDWNAAHTQIYTFVTLRIGRTLKGAFPSGEMRLRLLGGVAGDIAMVIPESPHFAVGDRVVMFVRSNPQSLYPVVGMAQGLFHQSLDPATGETRVSNDRGLVLPMRELEQRIADALAGVTP